MGDQASQTVALAQRLIREPSVTPEDGDCQRIIAEHLAELGFSVEHMPFGSVKNLWAVREGSAPGPLFVFAGHTDVVPPGALDLWERPPFGGELEAGTLHGRGAADMKGSLAAMLTAAHRFCDAQPDFAGAIGFLITSDEEGDATDGTVKVMAELAARGVRIDYCLVGEPSSSESLGDVIRVGRRGSLNGVLTVLGTQGHVAYPDVADNPIHRAAPALAALSAERWDAGNEFFPPTGFQISNIQGGTGAENVIPGELAVRFNFRFSTESTEASLRERTHAILDAHGLKYRLDWRLSGEPFITEGGELIPAVQSAIRQRQGLEPELSTAGGTSDGRFIAPHGAQVVELGPCNATIHKVNEQVSARELDDLSLLYGDVLEALLCAD